MHESYADIRDRLGEPLWWDEYAVPRYAPFTPDLCANIYAREAVLLLIACQDCGKRFHVAMTCDAIEHVRDQPLVHVRDQTLVADIRTRQIHYGDPPNVQCCPAGPTMNCIDIRVLEYWRRPGLSDWERDKSLEIDIDTDSSGT